MTNAAARPRLVGLVIVLLAAGVDHSQRVTAAPQLPYVSPGAPSVECTVKVHYDANAVLPGYFVDDPGGRVCVPFTYRAQFPPPDSRGDYVVEAFTDARIKAKYEACRRDPSCRARLNRPDSRPFIEVPHEFRVTGTVDPVGKIDPHGAVDLRKIRRPAYFGQPRFREPIAEADARTYTVEFLVPAEAYERLHMKRTGPVPLRGWYLEGAGVQNDRGEATRALVILVGGRSIETTAMQSPDERLYEYAETRGGYFPRTFPTATSEKWGVRQWRNYVYALNRVGFDVLTFDKRGHGISDGYNDSNTIEQARDMLRALDALETGDGVRLLSPTGELIEGRAAGRRLLAGRPAKEIPVLLGGPSQGSMTTVWAMHQNFIEDCAYDLPKARCGPARGYNVRGAILLAPFESGLGARPAPTDIEAGVLAEARLRIEQNIVMLPTSEPLAHIDKWPAVFFGRGLWDFAEPLEATYDAYTRVRGLKELAVVRGPHSENEYGPENVQHMTERVVAFARAAVLGLREVPGAARFTDIKSLVASSPPWWEPSNVPPALR
jgi:pimeloyl-ACP methyl ester carboxylesterase